MSRGKHLSFEEARKMNQLDRFAKEHPVVGDEGRLDKLMGAMVSEKKKATKGTSTQVVDED